MSEGQKPNGTKNVLNDAQKRADFIQQTLQQGGALTVLLVAGWWILTTFGQPLFDAHLKNLDGNTEAIKSLSTSVDALTKGVDTIIEVEEETQEFMKQVTEDHREQCESDDRIEGKVDIIIKHVEPDPRLMRNSNP
jgi:hypothetical protein